MQSVDISNRNRSASRILFVHNGRERFVQDDLALLRRSYQVTDWYQPTRYYNPIALQRAVQAHDIVFSWFASWHALAPVALARCMGKSAITVVGGYDTACVPEAGYGLQRGGIKRIVARMVIRWSTHLVALSQAAHHEAITQAGANNKKLSIIYPYVEPITSTIDSHRAQVVLTVGGVWRENLLRKGLLPFVQAAAQLPGVRFVHAGHWNDDSINDLRRVAGPNVEFRRGVTDTELAALYRSAAVYVQASLHEGFGLSVAEAMSAGCIPVVSMAGALPEVVGQTGVILTNTQPTTIARGIQQALTMPPVARLAVRERVLAEFPMERRREALEQLITTLTTRSFDYAV